MVKIRLRPSRRSSQNDHNHQLPLLHTSQNQTSTSDSENTNALPASTSAATQNRNQNHNSPLQSISDNTSNNSSNSTHPRPSSSSSSKNTARKVFNILDSPRRALVRGTSHRSHRKRSNSTSTKHTNNLLTNNSMKTPNSHPDEIMEVDVSPQYNPHPSPSAPNVMTWLHDEAPQDIIPKVMSYLGPQKHQIISKVSKSWRNICLSEGVFRTLCEDYGKWKPGTHTTPMVDCDYCHDEDCDEMDLDRMETCEDDISGTFWRDFYSNNPIVPLDYPTLKDAVHATGYYVARSNLYEYQKSVRILLHPGVHIVDNSIRVHVFGDALFTVETLEPPKCFKNLSSSYGSRDTSLSASSSSSSNSDAASSSSLSRNSTSTISTPPSQMVPLPEHIVSSRRRMNDRPNRRNIFSCRSITGAFVSDELDASQQQQTSLNSFNSFESSLNSDPNNGPKQASIVIVTKTHNVPIFHVTQGTLKLSNLSMVHNCNGVDIWNGNAVVQVQPKFIQNRPVLPKPGDQMPTAIVEDSTLTSISGRGVVAIDGGHSKIRKCRITNCAATGIYVGGAGSTAIAQDSDIIRNGFGNTRNRRGIARGHSGVYLEQGMATLSNCNISNNSLTGISAISQTNAFLNASDSDLAGNGTAQVELPPAGSLSRQRSVLENNTISANGVGRSRLESALGESNGARSLDVIERRILSPGVNSDGFVLPPTAIPLF